MVKNLAVVLAILYALAPSVSAQRAPRSPADTVPAPCGLWRPANPGVETDTYAFDFSSGLDTVFLNGPPISWSLVRDAGFVESPWLEGPNLIIELRLEGIEPKLAGDMLYVVDHHDIRYRLRPAATVGYWRFEGVYDVAQAKRLARIVAGENECVTGKDVK